MKERILKFLIYKLAIWKLFLILLIVGICTTYINIRHGESSGIVTSPELQGMTSYKGKDNKVYEKAKETIVTKQEMKKVTKDIKKNLNLSKVTHVNTSVQTIHDSIPVFVYIDTSKHEISAGYKDKDIRVDFNGSSETNLGTFYIDLVPDTVTEVFGVKNRLLRPNLTEVYFHHSNKLIKTANASSISFREPKVIAVIGPYVGYDFFSRKPSLGIAITFNIFGFKSK